MAEKLNFKGNVPAGDERSQSSGAMENRLEALSVLSISILREVEALKRTENSMMEAEAIDYYQEVHRFEMDLIRCALWRTGGNQTSAARLLNIKLTTLNAKMKRYGITANSIHRENDLGMLTRDAEIESLDAYSF